MRQPLQQALVQQQSSLLQWPWLLVNHCSSKTHRSTAAVEQHTAVVCDACLTGTAAAECYSKRARGSDLIKSGACVTGTGAAECQRQAALEL